MGEQEGQELTPVIFTRRAGCVSFLRISCFQGYAVARASVRAYFFGPEHQAD